MAITFSGATGALFTRFGHIAGIIRDLIALKGGTATTNVAAAASLSTRGTTLETDAAADPTLSPYLDGHWASLDSLRSGLSGGISQLRTIAEKLFVQQVIADTPLPVADIASAVAEAHRQMKVNSKTVNGSTRSIGAQTSLGSPTGTPSIVMTFFRGDGLEYQNCFAETLRFTVTADSYSGSQTARRETIQCRGTAAVSDVFSHLYPGGSSCSSNLTLVDAQVDGASGSTSGNLLVNGDLETYTTTNTPDKWVLGSSAGGAGAAGTDYFNDTSNPYTQTSGFKLTGDGSTLLAFAQTFETTAGSPVVLKPSTCYAVNFWIKALTSAPTAGTLRVALVDGDNAIINDDQGASGLLLEDDTALYLEDDTALYQEQSGNSFSVDLTDITTGFVAYSGVFRTPAVLPTTYKLQLKTSTPIAAGKSVTIDDIALAPMTQLYTGGPSAAVFAGTTKVVTGDAWTVAISNTRGVLADYLERFFGLAARGLILPYHDGGDETEADSLVA